MRVLIAVLSFALASCAPDGRERVGALLGVGEMREYQGVVNGFADTYYYARFVADPEVVEQAARRLGLRRYGGDEADSALADPLVGPLSAPGPPPVPEWWRPDRDIANGAVYAREWRSPERVDSTYAVATDRASGVTYVVIGYP